MIQPFFKLRLSGLQYNGKPTIYACYGGDYKDLDIYLIYRHICKCSINVFGINFEEWTK
jgi:hypothetical protein